jgi:SAM-dependent methyltransferase
MEEPTPATLSADTAARSLASWSEAGRDQMEAFYAFAALDYELLAKVADWGAALARAQSDRAEPGALRLLDVACGSGKFPSALLRRADLSALESSGVAYDLLDPSEFSLREAAAKLRPPFVAAERFETMLEDLDPAAGPWDVVWATHALYALEPAALEAAAERFAAGLARGAQGFMAQGTSDGHYLRVYRAFLDGMHGGGGTQYLAGEVVADALARAADPLGFRAAEHRLVYEHVVGYDQTELLEGYLRRCLFDDRPTLAEMLAAPVLGPYLAGCRDDAAEVYRFPQSVACLALVPEGVEFPWTAES